MTAFKRVQILVAATLLVSSANTANASIWWIVTAGHGIFTGEQVDMYCFVEPEQPPLQVAQLFRFVGLSCTWYPMHYPYSVTNHYTQDIDEGNPGSLILGDVLIDYWCCPAIEETLAEGVFEGRASGQAT